jgi:hypothetical protein
MSSNRSRGLFDGVVVTESSVASKKDRELCRNSSAKVFLCQKKGKP